MGHPSIGLIADSQLPDSLVRSTSRLCSPISTREIFNQDRSNRLTQYPGTITRRMRQPPSNGHSQSQPDWIPHPCSLEPWDCMFPLRTRPLFSLRRSSAMQATNCKHQAYCRSLRLLSRTLAERVAVQHPSWSCSACQERRLCVYFTSSRLRDPGDA